MGRGVRAMARWWAVMRVDVRGGEGVTGARVSEDRSEHPTLPAAANSSVGPSHGTRLTQAQEP